MSIKWEQLKDDQRVAVLEHLQSQALADHTQIPTLSSRGLIYEGGSDEFASIHQDMLSLELSRRLPDQFTGVANIHFKDGRVANFLLSGGDSLASIEEKINEIISDLNQVFDGETPDIPILRTNL